MVKPRQARKSAPEAVPEDWETIEMFSMEATGHGAERTKDRTVAYARCPHHGGERKTGLIRASRHLIYRVHSVTTWSGASIPCRASGAALCSAPDLDRAQPCDCQGRWAKL